MHRNRKTCQFKLLCRMTHRVGRLKKHKYLSMNVKCKVTIPLSSSIFSKNFYSVLQLRIFQFDTASSNLCYTTRGILLILKIRSDFNLTLLIVFCIRERICTHFMIESTFIDVTLTLVELLGW